MIIVGPDQTSANTQYIEVWIKFFIVIAWFGPMIMGIIEDSLGYVRCKFSPL